MIKQFTIYLSEDIEPSEIEEIYPDAFDGVPAEEKINVKNVIRDVGHELGVRVEVNTATGEHRIIEIE